MAGTEMLTIADLGRIEVRVDVSETDISKVKMGDSAVIEADAYRNKNLKAWFPESVFPVNLQRNKLLRIK